MPQAPRRENGRDRLRALPSRLPITIMLSLGTQTQLGKLAAVANGASYGERYYFMVDSDGAVAMMPAAVVEAAHEKTKQ